MASIKTKFSVGLFVIAGSTILATAVIWFGLSSYLEKGRYYAAYFEESVQGLGKDSAVKYRGVNIGRVEDIDVAPDGALICVVLKIEKNIDLASDMVAQLKPIGITGIMFVELDKKTKDAPDLSPKITFDSEYPVVATRPSEFRRTMQAIEDALNQINSLDVKGISDRTKNTLDAIHEAVQVVQIKEISESVRSSLEQLQEIIDPKQWQEVMDSIQTGGKSMESLIARVNETVGNINATFVRVDKIVQANEAGLSKALVDFTKSIEEVGDFLSEGKGLVQKTDRNLDYFQQQLTTTLQNLEKASRELNRSMEKIADQPSLLIFSKPLPERENHDDPKPAGR